MSVSAANGQDKTRLPAGHYIYLGADANASAPKALIITSDGTVNWQSDAPANAQTNASTDLIWQGNTLNPTSAATSSNATKAKRTDVNAHSQGQLSLTPKLDPTVTQAKSSVQPGLEHIESVEWPIIKFRPKPIPGTTDGFAQLTTTAEVTGSSLYCQTKYKLILLHAEPMHLTLELLDGNGFRLKQFGVGPNNFETIPGTDLVAARGEFSLSLNEYHQARDFSLLAPSVRATSNPSYPPRMQLLDTSR
jgi:hypothetical protein